MDAAAHLDALQARDAAHVLPTYGRVPLAFVRGEGSALFDGEGRPYLDFLCGLGVTSLGHAHPAVTDAVARQAATLTHVSNLFLTEPMLGLAERLARTAGWDDGKVFFGNSGAEANEAAIKLARRHGKRQHPDKVRLVTLQGSFHGRTLTTLEATAQPGKHEPFAPLAGFVDTVAWDDPEAVTAAVGPDTSAVLVEVVQGEGGVRPVPDEVLLAARAACDAHGALLVVDDVQAGVGRTGPWWSWQDCPVVPDAFTTAKALANGLPIGAVVAHGAAADAFAPGDHASTFGGGPVVCAAANAVVDTIESAGVLASAAERCTQLTEGLQKLADEQRLATGVRGRGLLLALTLDAAIAADVERACRERFLIVNAVRPDAIRLAPPLTVREDEVELALSVLGDALRAVADEREGQT